MRVSRGWRLLTPLLVGLIGLVSISGVAAADAGTEALAPRVGLPPPFRLMPDESISEPAPTKIDVGSEREPSDAGGHSFHFQPEDSSGPNRSGDRWRLAADDLTPRPETPPEQRASRLPATGPDWAGIGRDTAFFFGYQVVSVAILYALPGDINRWQNKDVSFENWWENVKTPPAFDSDPWGTNYISHPYWGATYYIRARERGFGKLASFGYSALLSTLYEYGPEAFFEPPSAQDLIVTPIVGSVIGAFVFEPIRDWVKAKPEFRWYDQALLIATDPLGTLNSVFERMLGIKSEILLRPSPPPP